MSHFTGALHLLEDLEAPERCPRHAVRLAMKFPPVDPVVEEQRVGLGCAPYGGEPRGRSGVPDFSINCFIL